MASQEPIEGTVLTEGQGMGKAVRIADTSGTVRLDTGGRERGIQGGQGGLGQGAIIAVDGRGAQVRARAINPLEVKPLITDGSGVSGHAVATAGDILSKAAFNYANRVTDLKADAAVVAYNEKARQAFFGADDGSAPGYSSLKGQAALDAKQSYFEGIDNGMAEILSSVEPEVRQKAAARLQGVRDQALNRAAGHIVQAQEKAEFEMKAAKVRDASRDLAVDSSNAMNLKMGLLTHFPGDSKEAEAQWDTIVLEAGHSKYINAERNGVSGVQILEQYRNDIKDIVSKKALNAFDEYAIAQKHQEESAQKAKEVHNERLLQKEENANVMKALDSMRDPKALESLLNPSLIMAAFPGIKDKDSVAFISRIAKEQMMGTVAKADALSTFDAAYLKEWRANDTLPKDFKEFYAAAHESGLKDLTVIRREWDEIQKPLSADEKVLDDQARVVIRDVIDTLEIKGSGRAEMDAAILSGKDVDLTMAIKGLPKEAKDIIDRVHAISRDKDKTPSERSKAIYEYIGEVKAAAGDETKVKRIGNFTALLTGYHVRSFTEKLNQHEAQTVIRPNPGTAKDPLWIAAANTLGVQPSKAATAHVMKKAEEAGYSNLHVVDGVLRATHVATGKITPLVPVKAPDYSDFEAFKVKLDTFKQETLSSIAKDMEDEVKELSKYAKETGKQNIKRLDEGMKNLYAKLTPQQKKEYDEELRKRMEKLKKAK